MRWEWRNLVRTRDWDGLERLAKVEPNQQLCDTVAELAYGLEEKSDVKRAKRILYLLREAGYSPETERPEPEPYAAATPVRFGYIGTTDPNGFLEIGTFELRKGRLRRIASAVHIAGVSAFWRFEDRPGQDLMAARSSLFRQEHPTRHFVEAPPDFCAGMMQVFIQARQLPGSHLPSAVRQEIESAERAFWHPGKRLGTLPATKEECATAWRLDPKSARWRLFLHRQAHPKTMAALREIEEGRSQGEDRVQARLAAIRAHRDEWLQPQLEFDAYIRHLDMAYVLRQRGEHETAEAFERVGVAASNSDLIMGYFEAMEVEAATHLSEWYDDMVRDLKHRLFAPSPAA
jgi:tellurite resistance protein